RGGAGCGAAGNGMAAQYDLVGFAQLAGAEVDACGKIRLRPRRAQPPLGTARQFERGAVAIIEQRGLDRRMQMEAQREGGASAAAQPVFAAQIVAVGRQVQFARIIQSETLAITVMARRDPLMAALLGALTAH